MIVSGNSFRADRDLPHRSIILRIGSIRITGEATPEQSMIQTRVKLYPIDLFSALYADPPKHRLPGFSRQLSRPIKRNLGGFVVQVRARIRDARVRKPNLYQDGLWC